MAPFKEVKGRVTARDVAEHYGMKFGRNGLVKCIFHDDKNPSMKVDTRFHCFGCQADGDAIDLAARLFGVPAKQAAEKLARDFGIPYGGEEKMYSVQRGKQLLGKTAQKPSLVEELAKNRAEAEMSGIYLDYGRLLKQWEDEYRPRAPDEEFDPRFVEAVKNRTYVEYVLDLLLDGSSEERERFVKDHGKEAGMIHERIQEYKAVHKEQDIRRDAEISGM